MASWRFVHAADVHLDSPLLGLAQQEGSPVELVRSATRRALERLVDLCIEEDARFLIIAGDLYDGDWRDYSTGLFFVRQMARLRQAEIRVFLLRGNHDAASVITKRLTLPDNVREFSARKAETIRLDDLDVAIHGMSYGKKAVTEDLSLHYPTPMPGKLNIGVLHTSAGGRPGHENYAPCRIEDLVNKGYDYWALGHVHQREILHQDPWVVFAGNLQGRQIREAGAKGAMLISVTDGVVTGVDFRPADVLRWTVCEINADGCDSADDALDLVRRRMEEAFGAEEGVALALRIRLTGRAAAHAEFSHAPEHWTEEVRALALSQATEDVWIEQVLFDTRLPIDLAAARQRDDPLGGLLRRVAAVRASEEDLQDLATHLSHVTSKLPPEVREGADGLDLADRDTLRSLLEDVEQLLVAGLLERGDA